MRVEIPVDFHIKWGHSVAQLVEALSYKPGSIPNGVIGIFH
jgi:hypothetical protein